ncbi:hypothetical protein H2200_007644 [Cladophialophora chaetospira]|uniref:histidine kinase n=1 Tax=Cladophialophora chaetospira TaxID=386627 RepID=A0AA38X691_9EURO|nr:hypothetical protein H2200_007644 [Cladophialophora chaetospira]
MDDCSLLADPYAPVLDIAKERKRRQEVYKYLASNGSSLLPITENAASVPSHSPLPAQLSQDPILNGLAQLGALRLGCDRSFVSLLDTNNQYIIAETTRLTPLYQKNLDRTAQEVAFGACAIDIALSVCLTTLPVFANPDGRYNIDSDNVSATPTRYLIRDFTKHEAFKDRPYVTAWPYLRFYYEVPLLSPGGAVLGTYCVIHNERRSDPVSAELSIMQEISSAIVQHLEQLRVHQEHERASRLLKGLDLFVEGQDSVRQWYLEDYASKPHHGLNAETPEEYANRAFGFRHQQDLRTPAQSGTIEALSSGSPSNTTSSFVATEDLLQPRRSPTTPATTMSLYSLDHDERHQVAFPFPVTHPSSTVPPHDSWVTTDVVSEARQNTLVSDEIKATFSRASNLLRESLDVDGVIYFDGQPRSFGSLVTNSTPTADRWSSLEDTDDATSGDQASKSSAWESCSDDQFAGHLGFSTRAKSSVANNTLSRLTLSVPERDLQYLIQQYPAGHVFLFDELGALSLGEESSGNDASRVRNSKRQKRKRGLRDPRVNLREWFHAAVAVAFLPLWTAKSETCVAACFAWSTERTQTFSGGDLTYFTTFGRSVSAEVTRLDMLSSDRAKSDFISSVSHELRSPLHGVLGSAEMLLELSPEANQVQIISMIQNCGMSLLETMDQILDFSKINTLSRNRVRRKLRIGQEPTKTGILEKISEFDMSNLVEDAIRAMLVGHRFKKSTTSDFNLRDMQNATPFPSAEADRECGVRVIFATENKDTWLVRSEAGAWKRILINLLGNALKYTQSGHIEVRLQSARLQDHKAENADPNTRLAVLSVKDTGQGISRSYLQKHLFHPFAQENGLSDGTGLGLSIVKQLVDCLGGAIDISSETNVGTEIMVSVPLVYLPNSKAPLYDGLPLPSISNNLKVCLLGMDIYPAITSDESEAPSGILSPYSRFMLVLKSVLASQLSEGFHALVTSASTLKDAVGDVVVIPQEQLSLLSSSEDGIWYERPQGSTLLILCDHVPISSEHGSNDFVQFLGAPYGPKQLAAALNTLASRLQHAEQGPFTFAVPFAVEPAKAKLTLTLHNSPEQSNSNKSQKESTMKVLLVDDNPINLKMLVMYMTKLRCKYLTATNGREAVEAYRDANGTIDYILMDMSMPVMDGFAATREIRALEAARGRHRCIIVALTGLGSSQAQQNAYSSGVNIYLPKPVAMKTIKELISAAGS